MSEEESADLSSLLSEWSLMPEPDACTKIIKRLRAMILKLLPVEVEPDLISEATSAIISPTVVKAFAQAGGDFVNALPYCLMAARASFIYDANRFPTDEGENRGRALACEVLARRIVHALPSDKLQSVMSTRFRYREIDGDQSPPTSALETAIDQNAVHFLSSTEVQHVIDSLWRGEWVQRNNKDADIDYEEYDTRRHHTFWAHMNPQRLGVPRYQNFYRQTIWIIFLFIYSQATSSPLYKIDAEHQFDGWEIALYVLAISQCLEELVKMGKTVRLAPNILQAIGFWTVVNVFMEGLLIASLGLRLRGVFDPTDEGSGHFRLRAFQVLACASPFLWIKLVTIFDGWKVVGTMQVVTFRMLRESAIFFILLAIMAIGFVQSMVALDAADGEVDNFGKIINLLIQALLGSPDFDSTSERFSPPFGLIIYYAWSFFTIIILLNILIALFGTAYSDIYDDATNQYLCSYAFKTVSMIRAPDSFVYPAPFNLVEAVFVVPFEFFLSRENYRKLNIFVMTIIFFIPLSCIALYESRIRPSQRFADLFPENNPEIEGDPTVENPEFEDENGHRISTVPFDELTAHFPDTTLGSQASIVVEIAKLNLRLQRMEKEMGLGRKQEESLVYEEEKTTAEEQKKRIDEEGGEERSGKRSKKGGKDGKGKGK